MAVTIKTIEQFAEMRAVEGLQQAIWNLSDRGEIAPAHLMITFQKNGGLLQGAYVDGRLVGFSLGFLGMSDAGQLKLCSAMLGVLPRYRDRKIGERLKWAQREVMLARGIDLISWTYDPLETRNARLNLHKLGAICNRYYEELYGEMEGNNAGLPSDRFEVAWRLDSDRVAARRRQEGGLDLTALLGQGVPIVNPPQDGRPIPVPETVPPVKELLLAVPWSIQALKTVDMELAFAWRLHTRGWFQLLFAAGFVARDLFLGDTICFYYLTRETAAA